MQSQHSCNPTIRDGAGMIDNLNAFPNHIPGDQDDVTIVTKDYEAKEHEEWVGTATAFDSFVTKGAYFPPREF